MNNINHILISCNHTRGGKTTYAQALKKTIEKTHSNCIVQVLSLAYYVKEAFKKTTEYKLFDENVDVQNDEFKTTKLGNKTGREYIKEFAEEKCSLWPFYWCNKLYEDYIKHVNQFNSNEKFKNYTLLIIVEDIRKVYELSFFRKMFEGKITHKHLNSIYGYYDEDFPDTKDLGLLFYLADKYIPYKGVS